MKWSILTWETDIRADFCFLDCLIKNTWLVRMSANNRVKSTFVEQQANTHEVSEPFMTERLACAVYNNRKQDLAIRSPKTHSDGLSEHSIAPLQYHPPVILSAARHQLILPTVLTLLCHLLHLSLCHFSILKRGLLSQSLPNPRVSPVQHLCRHLP